MLINIRSLTRLPTTAQLLQHEHLGSFSEKEKLHGAAPDQEEKKVSLSHGFAWLMMLADLEEL